MITQPPLQPCQSASKAFLASVFLPPPCYRYTTLIILGLLLFFGFPTTANAQEGGVITISNTKPEGVAMVLCPGATLIGMDGVPVYRRTNGVFEYAETWAIGTPVRVLRVVEAPTGVYWEVERKDLGWKAWAGRLVVRCADHPIRLVESAAICAGTISAPSTHCSTTFTGVAEAFWLNLTFADIHQGDKIELKMYDPSGELIRQETMRWRGTGLRLQNRSFVAEDMTVVGRYTVHIFVNDQFTGKVPVIIKP